MIAPLTCHMLRVGAKKYEKMMCMTSRIDGAEALSVRAVLFAGRSHGMLPTSETGEARQLTHSISPRHTYHTTSFVPNTSFFSFHRPPVKTSLITTVPVLTGANNHYTNEWGGGSVATRLHKASSQNNTFANTTTSAPQSPPPALSNTTCLVSLHVSQTHNKHDTPAHPARATLPHRVAPLRKHDLHDHYTHSHTHNTTQ
jgi:hypothetical protein